MNSKVFPRNKGYLTSTTDGTSFDMIPTFANSVFSRSRWVVDYPSFASGRGKFSTRVCLPSRRDVGNAA